MRYAIAVLVLAGMLSGCVPLVVGGVAGYEAARHDQWVWMHRHHMPMGVHR